MTQISQPEFYLGDLQETQKGVTLLHTWVVWLVVLGLTALSVYSGPSPRQRERGERKDRGEEMSKLPPSAPIRTYCKRSKPLPYYYSPTCIKQAPKGQSKSACLDRCLLNTGTFQCIFHFLELTTCLLNTCCLLNRGGH